MANLAISTMVVFPKIRDDKSLLVLEKFNNFINEVQKESTPDSNDLFVCYEKAFPELSEDEIWNKTGCGTIFMSEPENKNFCKVDDVKNADFIRVDYESKWNPMIKGFDEIVEKVGEGLLAEYTISEEEGCLIFINTDKEKRFFTEEWFLNLNTEFDEETYRFTQKELLEYFNDAVVNKKFENIEDLMNWIDDYNDSEESEEKGYYINLYKFADKEGETIELPF